MRNETFFKVIAIILLVCLVANAHAQGVDIPINLENENLYGSGGRPLIPNPSVSMSSEVLTINYPSATETCILIINQNTNQTVYSDSFASTTQVIIDLDDEGIGEGSYMLRVYAFGKWWWGEFVLEDE